MLHLRIAFVTVAATLGLFVAACNGSDDDPTPVGTGGNGGEASSGDAGAGPSRAGTLGTSDVEFTDLPGKIRFINHVSDGTAGVPLDLYWGTSIGRGEKVATVAYGEITEFLTPRHSETGLLKPDEARYFLVPEGDVSGTPASFLVQNDETFTDATVFTIALAAAESLSDDLTVAAQLINEAELSTPPAGMAHVYEWSQPFQQIEDGDFVLVGAEGLCDPDRGEPGGANLGSAFLVPDGTTGLALFDANTEPPCDTGTLPAAGAVEAGHSYVLLAEAETYEIDARQIIMLELGLDN